MFLQMSVETQRTTRRHIPEDDTLYNHRCGTSNPTVLQLFTLAY
jgi:hypothetical protein